MNETIKDILFGKDRTRCLYPEDEDLEDIVNQIERHYKAKTEEVLAEVIGSNESTTGRVNYFRGDGKPDTEIAIENKLKDWQRQRAANLGFELNKEKK